MIKFVKAKQKLWHTRKSSRDQLRTMDIRLLRDIGVTPMEAFKEVRKPFWRG